MATYADLEDLFQENQAATAYNLPGRNRVNPEMRQAAQDAEEERTRPAPDQSQLEGRSSEEDEVNSSETQTASAGVPQQEQNRGTTAPQSGLMRITHGDQSYLADPMSGQNYSAPGQPLQQQQPQQQGAPISPEMRAAWPYLNNQQRAAMLQHREQTQSQSWLNQQKLTQADVIRNAKNEQARSMLQAAVDNGSMKQEEVMPALLKIKHNIDIFNMRKEKQEADQLARRNKFAADNARQEGMIGATGETAATSLRMQNVTGKGETFHYDDGTSVNGWRNKDGEFVPHKEAGAGKGHDVDPAHHTDLATKRLAASKDGEGKALPPASAEEVAKEAQGTMDAEKILRQRAEEDKLPGVRDDKGERGKIREAAKQAVNAHPAQKKIVMKALAELDRIAQLPRKALTPQDVEVWKQANQIAAPYLPAAEAPPVPESLSSGGSGYHPVIGAYPTRKPDSVTPAKRPTPPSTVPPFIIGA